MGLFDHKSVCTWFLPLPSSLISYLTFFSFNRKLPSVEKISYASWNSEIFKKDFIYSFLERVEGREKERERNINVWLPLVCPLLGTWPTTQAWTLTGNRTGDSLVHRPALNALSHTSRGAEILTRVYIIIKPMSWVFSKKVHILLLFSLLCLSSKFSENPQDIHSRCDLKIILSDKILTSKK